MFANNESSPTNILCTIIFTSITIDRVFLLLKAHLLGVTVVLYSRNVASLYYLPQNKPFRNYYGLHHLIIDSKF